MCAFKRRHTNVIKFIYSEKAARLKKNLPLSFDGNMQVCSNVKKNLWPSQKKFNLNIYSKQKKTPYLGVIPTLIRNIAKNVKSMGTLENICAVLKKAMMHFFNSWHQAASHTNYFSENNLRIIFSLENHI